MFNYYRRIASLALEMEMDGRGEKADWMRLILQSENRCIFCGCDLSRKENEKCKGAKKCLACSTAYERTSFK